MSGFEFNAEKVAPVKAEQAPGFSALQADGYSSQTLIKVADDSMVRGIRPVHIICPDGTVAGQAGTKQQAIKLIASCGEKG